MSNQDGPWRYAAEDGVEYAVEEYVLLSLLAEAQLPPYTLVWTVGWGEWLPAMQVAELEGALAPQQRDRPVTPRPGSGGNPPSPPLYRYPVFKRRASMIERGLKPTDDSDPLSSAQIPRSDPTASGQTFSRDATPATDTGPPADAYESGAFDRLAYNDGDDDQTIVDPPSLDPSTSDDPEAGYTTDGSGNGRPPTPSVPPPMDRRTSDKLVAARQSVSPGLPHIPAPPPPPPEDLTRLLKPGERSSDRKYWLIAAALVALISVMLIAITWSQPSGGELAAPAVDENLSATAVPVPASNGVPQCRVSQSAKRIGEWAHQRVAPVAVQIPSSNRIALGFAQTPEYAIGLAVDVPRLTVDSVFQAYKKSHVTSVVPTAASGSLRFAVARGATLKNERYIDATPKYSIGLGEAGYITSVAAAGTRRQLWKADAPITTPRVVTLADGRSAVTYRQGGKTGKIVAAWLNADGSPAGNPQNIGDGSLHLGTPSIAGSDTHVLVGFAAKSSSSDGWGVRLATAPHGTLPVTSRAFQTPPGGPGERSMSPVATPLSIGYWLLQWTEGRGTHVVRAQVLSPDLQASGPPLQLSAGDSNAGQGSIWSSGSTVLSVFFVKLEDHSELWATSVSCQP
ncbi:MAG: DUF4339 domain-containing protein [Polyangiaceae bacterium]|nr:DUF4339 domain-containing protein [Polyangiaceae bacterium]